VASSDSDVERWIQQMFKKYLPALDSDQASTLLAGAIAGGEVDKCGSPEAWFKERASFATVTLDHMDYVTALTQSLRIAPNLAPTDYGGSRQRDLGQLWTDVARGFLGEIGLAKFVKERFGAELVLDYSLGPIETYLPSDIKGIRLQNGQETQSKLKISFKTTKFNGIWLDIPGAQVTYSDAFVLIKLGISRDHFVAFLKWISFIRDKLLPHAMKTGTIDQAGAQQLWDNLPNFRNIPCYVAGFMDRKQIESPPPPHYRPMHKRDGTLKGYLMKSYLGWVKDTKPDDVPDELKTANWQFESIGSFSKENHFVATSGCLKYSREDWKALLNEATGGNLG
jgi:hypothetical protein